MNRLRLMMAFTLAAAVGSFAAPLAAAAGPINVLQCFVIKPTAMSHKSKGTQIDYVNVAHKTATSITFAVGYRNAEHHFVRRVTDVGTFAPHAEIRHAFPLYSDVTYAGQKVHGCAAISVTFSDGTKWLATM